MKDVFALIEENKLTGEGFVRGQTTDGQKGLDWAKENAQKSAAFVKTGTGFATKGSAFDVINKSELK